MDVRKLCVRPRSRYIGREPEGFWEAWGICSEFVADLPDVHRGGIIAIRPKLQKGN
jgi:hypothetical protein